LAEIEIMQELIELVVREARARGLEVNRLPSNSRRNPFDKRLLLIEGKRCQAIPSRRAHPNPEYPQAEYYPLYLPRSEWPDFLIYVAPIELPIGFFIVPRLEVSKDTGRSPGNLEQYRDAWELLTSGESESSIKKFEVLNWQLEAVTKSASSAGLTVEHIKTKKNQYAQRWPPIIKRRVIIAGKKCALYSAARLSQDPSEREYNYALFKVSEDTWPEFQIHIVRSTDDSPDLFVVPKGHITSETTASLAWLIHQRRES
jgi:hypothetical protein